MIFTGNQTFDCRDIAVKLLLQTIVIIFEVYALKILFLYAQSVKILYIYSIGDLILI